MANCHRERIQSTIATLACGLAMAGLSAQTATPRFDAVSIKANRSGDSQQILSIAPDGSYTLTNATVRMLIRQAYRVQEFQIADAPDWTETERFDVKARAPAGSTAAAVPDMVRSLLEERFGVVARRETREMPVFVLTLARENALGPRLRRTAPDAAAVCAASRTSSSAASRRDGLPCGIGTTGGTITAGDASLSQLAGLLSPIVGRVTIDGTGLTGTFDFDLNWTPDPFFRGPSVPVADPAAPTLFTALQEQLGLRLASQRAPTEILLIERIHEPTQD
jgi:uncharacterized protein (TIGR03435 family)